MFIQAVVPWASSEDIVHGTLWRTELAKELEAGSVGILCVTRENVRSPWVNFEAGALSKLSAASRVIPFFFQMRPSQVVGPLADRQGTTFERGSAKNRDEFRKLLESLNSARTPSLVQETVLAGTFEKMWPDVEAALES